MTPSPRSDPSRTVEFLRQVPLLARLKEEALGVLARFCLPAGVAAGETIYTHGDTADALYLVEEGAVELLRLVPHGERLGETSRAFARREAGDFFGESEILRDSKRADEARAVEPGFLLRIRRDDLVDFLKDQPIVTLKLEMAAARTASFKAAAALGTTPRRSERHQVGCRVVVEPVGDGPKAATLVDLSLTGLRLDGVPDNWQPDRRLPFQLSWRDHVLRLEGRVAWRRARTVGVEIRRRTPENDNQLRQVLNAMLAQPA